MNPALLTYELQVSDAGFILIPIVYKNLINAFSGTLPTQLKTTEMLTLAPADILPLRSHFGLP